MKSKKSEVRLLYHLIQHKNRWYVKATYPYNEKFEEIANRAKDYANDILMKISFRDFYNAFLTWDKDDEKIVNPYGNPYYEFLHDFTWELGKETTEGMERDWYADSIDLNVKFI